METAPMAGKSWQPSHEPPRGKKAGISHAENISGKEEGRGGRWNHINWVPTFVIRPCWINHTKSCWTPQNGGTLMNETMLGCTLVPGHDGSWVMRILHTPLASKVKQVLLVNSIKLHLTAFNNCFAKWRLGACDAQELPPLAASS